MTIKTSQLLATYLIIYFWKAKVFCFLVIRFDNIKEFDFRYTKFIYLHCGEEKKIKRSSQLRTLLKLVERCTGIAEVMGSNTVRAWIFQVFFSTTRFSSVLSGKDLLISSKNLLYCRIKLPCHLFCYCNRKWTTNDFSNTAFNNRSLWRPRGINLRVYVVNFERIIDMSNIIIYDKI